MVTLAPESHVMSLVLPTGWAVEGGGGCEVGSSSSSCGVLRGGVWWHGGWKGGG